MSATSNRAQVVFATHESATKLSTGHRTAIAHGEPETGEGRSLAATLAQAVARFADGRFIFMDGRGQLQEQSYAATWEKAKRVLNGLREQGIQPGDEVILYFRSCRSFIPAVWACFMGGMLALPLFCSEGHRNHARTATLLSRLREILRQAHIVTDVSREHRHKLGITPDATEAEALERASPTDVAFESDEPDQPRLLILSSGTTATPKLVALSARAVTSRWWHRLPADAEAKTLLSWTPFDHVMGLATASPNVPEKVHLATDGFVRHPELWLDAIDRLHVTHCTMTNFGMSLIEQRLASLTHRVDLSSIRKIAVGAEAVSPALCRRFITALQPFGLRPDALIIGYGLTECGPVVGSDRHVEIDDVAEAGQFALLDRPRIAHSVRIVGEDGALLAEDETGVIEVRGPSMALGYYADDQASSELFTDDGWIKTGDLGLLRAGRLMITGREKETIHLNAKKYSSLEIEAMAQSVPSVEEAFAVAFPSRHVDRERGEGFILFFVAPQSSPARVSSLKRELRSAIAKKLGTVPAHLIPIVPEDVPRTASGKVQRFVLASRFAAGEFGSDLRRRGAELQPSLTPVEQEVANIWRALLGTDQFGIDDDFFEVGGDSLKAFDLLLQLATAFRLSLPEELLHEHTTILQLASFIERHSRGERTSVRAEAASGGGGEADNQPDARLAPELEARLHALTADWEGKRLSPSALLVGLNPDGEHLPLFWCIQLHRQLSQLSKYLGPDQPLYGMRSGSLVMDYSDSNKRALARRYIEEILQIDSTGPYILGGVCQGNIVALEIAKQLQQCGRTVQLLTLLDTSLPELFHDQHYAGRVAFFAGAKGRFNPYRLFRTPEVGMRKQFPGGFRLEMLPADYGGFFRDKVMEHLAPKLQAVLDWANEPASPSQDFEQTNSGFAYRGFKLDVRKKIELWTGQQALLPVKLTNESSLSWEPFDCSGLAIGNHWLSRSGEIVVWADGRTQLSERVEPGQAVELDLWIRAPSAPGKYLVEIDLVEEGVTWFKEKGGATAFIAAKVSEIWVRTFLQRKKSAEGH